MKSKHVAINLSEINNQSATACKVANYRHAPGAKWPKVFENGRHFDVLVSSAYDVGIVGPEDNGIVILDEDNSAIVLDRHIQESSGYFGPSARQLSEAQRILNMEWVEFAEFILGNPRYRQGSVPDIHNNVPDDKNEASQEREAQNREILPDKRQIGVDAKNKDEPIFAPLTRRNEIVDWLAEHSFHRDGPCSPFRLSWNVKMYMVLDDSGHAEGYANDPKYDARWEKYLSDHRESIFGEIMEDMRRMYSDAEYNTYPGADQGDYEFGFEGRQNGHMVLTRCGSLKGRELRWDDKRGFREWAAEVSDEDLAKLYVLTASVDWDTRSNCLASEYAYQIAYRRQEMEGQWNEQEEHELTEEKIEAWTINDVVFTVTPLRELASIEGNVLASGDDNEDRRAEDAVREDLESGNRWAWCVIRVEASHPDIEDISGEAYLGQCSYKSREDFIKNSGYYEDMKLEALDALKDEARQSLPSENGVSPS